MGEAEHAGQEERLEECAEDVALGQSQEHDAQEGRDGAAEHRRAHVAHRGDHALGAGACVPKWGRTWKMLHYDVMRRKIVQHNICCRLNAGALLEHEAVADVGGVVLRGAESNFNRRISSKGSN